MKTTSSHRSATRARSIATHSLVAAIFTQPYILSLLADAYGAATGHVAATDAAKMGNLLDTMAFISFIALSLSIISGIYWLVKRSK